MPYPFLKHPIDFGDVHSSEEVIKSTWNDFRDALKNREFTYEEVSKATASVLAYWYLVKYFWLLLPFYGTIKETAVISYGKTKKVQNQTYG